MGLSIEIPDELSALLAANGDDPARAALEAIALQLYREHCIGSLQLRTLLGIPSRYALDALLKKHRIEKYTADDFDQDLTLTRSRPSEAELRRGM